MKELDVVVLKALLMEADKHLSRATVQTLLDMRTDQYGEWFKWHGIHLAHIGRPNDPELKWAAQWMSAVCRLEDMG